jgi:hypothetical protein
MWCPIADALGDKIVTSVPRSFWNFSCAPSRLSRIWSSLIVTGALVLVGDGWILNSAI